MASKKQQQPIFPEQKESIPRDTAVSISSILESYNERGQQFSREGINYSPITLLTTISNLYLIKKYNTNCFMYGNNGKDENFIYGGFAFNFAARELDLPIERLIPNILLQVNGNNLFQIRNFLNCIKNMQPTIIIPLLLQFSDGTHHANMLIYRRDLNTIEHFEPHGAFLDLRKDYGDKITIILQTLIDKINEFNNDSASEFYHILPGNINLIPSNEICVRGPGLQAIQSQLASFRIEGSGYCQMWSLLFAELALLNPSINSRQILDHVYELLRSQDGPVFLSNIIRGYVSMLGEEISLYLSQYINNVFTIENISYICQILFAYARYLSEILTFIVYIEVNIEVLFKIMPKTMAQLDDVEARLQGSLSNYFRLQNELKELLINRKQNYSTRGKDAVDAEIVAKLREEFNEYAVKKKDIKNFVQNKIFQNYLRKKQEIVAVGEKKAKAPKKVKEVLQEDEDEDDAKKATVAKRNSRTKKGGKKYKKKSRKHRKSKKYRKYKTNRHLKF